MNELLSFLFGFYWMSGLTLCAGIAFGINTGQVHKLVQGTANGHWMPALAFIPCVNTIVAAAVWCDVLEDEK